ncbi:MAG: PAS domain-containing protein [Rhodospirillaceae bacterium]|jgi:PAS domain S-box-containing protein|nr:PAS domain-containing protein [Rhodospirillaceae bacterium]MBT5374472.1 PAS domain-containing protein [Rhodospirillaceae bacterium]MBT5659955.1 PAS domain-containing protein [Rhodospirillaceae bacterium]MBT5751265.1 PAS domain-containing protein [Rhodospirillaceae bacterium]
MVLGSNHFLGESALEDFLTGNELTFPEDGIIVSKTDLKGHITYGNETFFEIAGYSEHELLGQPHNSIRHPEMPRCVFKLLWDTIQGGNEIFAYVVNQAKNGDYYWVNAHVTPSFDSNGAVIGYHSNRRVPNRQVITDVIAPLYQALRAEERKNGDKKEGTAASTRMLTGILEEKGIDYERFVHSL